MIFSKNKIILITMLVALTLVLLFNNHSSNISEQPKPLPALKKTEEKAKPVSQNVDTFAHIQPKTDVEPSSQSLTTGSLGSAPSQTSLQIVEPRPQLSEEQMQLQNYYDSLQIKSAVDLNNEWLNLLATDEVTKIQLIRTVIASKLREQTNAEVYASLKEQIINSTEINDFRNKIFLLEEIGTSEALAIIIDLYESKALNQDQSQLTREIMNTALSSIATITTDQRPDQQRAKLSITLRSWLDQKSSIDTPLTSYSLAGLASLGTADNAQYLFELAQTQGELAELAKIFLPTIKSPESTDYLVSLLNNPNIDDNFFSLAATNLANTATFKSSSALIDWLEEHSSSHQKNLVMQWFDISILGQFKPQDYEALKAKLSRLPEKDLRDQLVSQLDNFEKTLVIQ